jgi:hypothetical protein
MPRSLGSPNTEYKWMFILYNPLKPLEDEILIEANFTSIKQMHETMKDYFSLSQLTSYASRNRNYPKIIEIKRI